MSGSDQAVGDFRIISIEHIWDDIGNYTNEFVAIPALIKTPPVGQVIEPYCETQSAIVVGNYDNGELGRVRVRFHWMDEMEKSPWLQMTMSHAGPNAGMYMLPEIGAEVLVSFVGGNAARPYVIGEVYNGKAKVQFGNAGNDNKVIQTRSGINITMNDKEGSIKMEDKKGNRVHFDGEGKVTMNANDKMELTCGEAKIILDKNGNIQISGKKIKVDATNEIKITSKDNANITAGTLVEVESAMIKLN